MKPLFAFLFALGVLSAESVTTDLESENCNCVSASILVCSCENGCNCGK